MEVDISYGESTLRITLPNDSRARVLRGPRAPRLADPLSQIESRLARPARSPALSALSRGREQACVVISDNTRAVPNHLLLPAILEAIRPFVSRIRVLVASGLHTPLHSDDLSALSNRCSLSDCEVIAHNARDAQALATLGETDGGVPVRLNRAYLDSDLRILTGLVEPHFMAGYSGGRKSICPGIAGAELIQWIHSPQLLESPRADYCILQGNPVHEACVSIARKAEADFIVNLTINSEAKVSHVAAGEMEAAWMDCVKHVSKHAETAVHRPADIVITSNGGFPLDRNYYQAIKGLVSAARVVRENGVIILAAECRDGLGGKAFRSGLRELRDLNDLDAYIDHISSRDSYVDDQWEVEKLVHVLRKTRNLFILSDGLTAGEARLSFAESVSSVEEALSYARSLVGANAGILIMPQGPYLIPTLLA